LDRILDEGRAQNKFFRTFDTAGEVIWHWILSQLTDETPSASYVFCHLFDFASSITFEDADLNNKGEKGAPIMYAPFSPLFVPAAWPNMVLSGVII